MTIAFFVLFGFDGIRRICMLAPPVSVALKVCLFNQWTSSYEAAWLEFSKLLYISHVLDQKLANFVVDVWSWFMIRDKCITQKHRFPCFRCPKLFSIHNWSRSTVLCFSTLYFAYAFWRNFRKKSLILENWPMKSIYKKKMSLSRWQLKYFAQFRDI